MMMPVRVMAVVPMPVAIYMMVMMVAAIPHVALTHVVRRRFVTDMWRTNYHGRWRKDHARRLKYDAWSGPVPLSIVAMIVSG